MDDAGAIIPAYRRGAPRPIELHLSAAMISALAGLRGSAGGAERASALLKARRAIAETLEGIERYQRHPYRAPPMIRPVFWSRGTTRLLDFGGAGPPVLVVPSLINRAGILDMAPMGSFLRWLAARGRRVLLLDWADPGREELGFSLDDYALQRIVPALGAASRLGPVDAVGYCMGGTLLVGALSARPGAARRVVTLGAPWRFHATPFAAPLRARADTMAMMLGHMETLFGAVPAEVIQSLFAARDITVTAGKLRRLTRHADDAPEAVAIVALQDWLNDGVALPARAARQCFQEWFIDDLPGKGAWHIDGARAHAAAIDAPLLTVAPQRDPICPPDSTRPLAEGAAGAVLLLADVGHIGLVTGGARDKVWAPLAAFLRG